MKCPNCLIDKPKREFRLRDRHDYTKPRYGIACNECRSKLNRSVSSAVKLTDAYCVWMIRQGHAIPKDQITPDLIEMKRKSITLKRILRKWKQEQAEK